MPASFDRTATRLGYRAVCSSRVGLWRDRGAARDIPRLAILANTAPAQFARWLRQDSREMLQQRLRYAALASGKRLLGNANYERMRRGLLRLAGR